MFEHMNTIIWILFLFFFPVGSITMKVSMIKNWCKIIDEVFKIILHV
jgi:hypothetical protein